MSSVVRDTFVSVVTKLKDDLDATNVVKKLMMKSIEQRELNIQEVRHQLLSLNFFSSPYQAISLSLDGSRKIKFEDGELVT